MWVFQVLLVDVCYTNRKAPTKTKSKKMARWIENMYLSEEASPLSTKAASKCSFLEVVCLVTTFDCTLEYM